jgi:hypothetical protein
MFGVRVKDSTAIPGQQGLFAMKANYPNNVAFRPGDLICPYYGNVERENPRDIDQPYAVSLRGPFVINADCYRSLASNANSNRGLQPRRTFNAKLVNLQSDPANQRNFGQIYQGQDIVRNHLSAPTERYDYVALRADKTIKVGDEILLTYGPDYQFHDDNVTTKYLRNQQAAERLHCNQPVEGSGISSYTKEKAKKLGVKVRESKQPKKKLDVLIGREVVASIGDKSYKDYAIHLKEKGESYANERRALYKKRHEGTRHKVGSPSYYADQLLW